MADIARALALLASCFLLACAGGTAPPGAAGAGDGPANVRAELGEEVTLESGQLALYDGAAFGVRFLEVVEDSRCPVNVECVTAGNAVVRLRLSDAYGGRVRAELNTTVGPKSASHSGYTVELIALRPEPTAGIRIPPASYRAILRATKG